MHLKSSILLQYPPIAVKLLAGLRQSIFQRPGSKASATPTPPPLPIVPITYCLVPTYLTEHLHACERRPTPPKPIQAVFLDISSSCTFLPLLKAIELPRGVSHPIVPKLIVAANLGLTHDLVPFLPCPNQASESQVNPTCRAITKPPPPSPTAICIKDISRLGSV